MTYNAFWDVLQAPHAQLQGVCLQEMRYAHAHDIIACVCFTCRRLTPNFKVYVCRTYTGHAVCTCT
jgi:hypothetical protein